MNDHNNYDKKMNRLRELQLTELEILKTVDRTCKDLGLTYFLDGGTLLGAVRHGGFIPWDDDIDIVMPYKDYEQFITYGQQKLGDKFFVQNMETDPNFNLSFTRVRLNGTTCMNSYQINWKVHHGVWIDVFPIVPLKGKVDYLILQKVFSICNLFHIDQKLEDTLYYEEYTQLLTRFGMSLLKTFYHIPMKKRIKWHKCIVQYFCRREMKECCSVLWGNITTFYPKNYFKEATIVSFESINFPAPKNKEEYLENTYGDYMTIPPEEERKTHGIDILDLNHDYNYYVENNLV